MGGTQFCIHCVVITSCNCAHYKTDFSISHIVKYESVILLLNELNELHTILYFFVRQTLMSVLWILISALMECVRISEELSTASVTEAMKVTRLAETVWVS